MDDPSIRIKPFSRRAAGSLAQRVLFGGLALLVLPLLVHTFLLYHREYRQNEADAFEALSLLADSRTLYIEQTIHGQEDLLNALASRLPQENLPPPLDPQAAAEHGEKLLYIENTPSGLSCSNALCQDPALQPLLQQALRQDHTAFFHPENPDWFFITKTVPPRGLLLIAIPTTALIRSLPTLANSNYPIRFSFLDAEGHILISTEPGFSAPLTWNPVSHTANAWILRSDAGKYLAVKKNIEGIPYTLLVDVPAQSVTDLQMKNYLFRIFSFLAIVLVFGGALLLFFTSRVSKPLRSLGSVMQRVSEGATHVRFLPDRMGFEINVIGLQLNQMLDSLLAHQQEAERERLARERLAQELRIGHEIQASMLPTHLPDFPSLEITPGYLPAREVSGDFYDFLKLPDGRLLISIADAADKGISACLYSLSFRSMLRTAAFTKPDLAAIVTTANTLLLQDTADSSSFITAWVGLYDAQKKQLLYCSQGHPPAFLRKANGTFSRLASPGMALGIQAVEPRVEELLLEPGDLLFLYTDGILDAHDVDKQLFGEKRLREFLERCGKKSTQALIDQLLEEIHLFCSGAPQADDLTLLALRMIDTEIT